MQLLQTVPALKLREDARLAAASRWRAQHPRPVSLTVEESLFKELNCHKQRKSTGEGEDHV
jgi:hypothetical protein